MSQVNAENVRQWTEDALPKILGRLADYRGADADRLCALVYGHLELPSARGETWGRSLAGPALTGRSRLLH